MRSIFGKDQKKNQAKFLNTYYWFPGVLWTLVALLIFLAAAVIGDDVLVFFVVCLMAWVIYAWPHYLVY